MVLDEADLMIDMRLKKNLMELLEYMHPSDLKPDEDEHRWCIYIFGTTYSSAMKWFANSYTKNKAQTTVTPTKRITVLVASDTAKMGKLERLLDKMKEPTLVFANTKKDVEPIPAK